MHSRALHYPPLVTPVLYSTAMALAIVSWRAGHPLLTVACWIVLSFLGHMMLLAFHEAVHYHLARVLDEAGRPDEAELHWRTVVELMPESPWAENARRRLGLQPGAMYDAESDE